MGHVLGIDIGKSLDLTIIDLLLSDFFLAVAAK
jgi:hypothetical protein